MEFEIKNTSPFTLVLPKMKYLFIYREKTHRIINTILKENKMRELTPSDFETYHRAMVISTG